MMLVFVDLYEALPGESSSDVGGGREMMQSLEQLYRDQEAR